MPRSILFGRGRLGYMDIPASTNYWLYYPKYSPYYYAIPEPEVRTTSQPPRYSTKPGLFDDKKKLIGLGIAGLITAGVLGFFLAKRRR